MQQLQQIPFSFQAMKKPSQESLPEVASSVEKPLALIVDDQPAIRDMLAWMLHLQGFQAVGTMNGQACLEWLANAQLTRQYPSVILLDLPMPREDGIQFVMDLRKRWSVPAPLPPIILLTVVKGNYDFLQCSDVLIKPFRFADLCKCLRFAIGRSEMEAVED